MLESTQLLVARVWGDSRHVLEASRARNVRGKDKGLRSSGRAGAGPVGSTSPADHRARARRPRAASISRIAEELGRRGEEIVELFKEVVSPTGARAVFPIHLRRGEEDVFVEVETGAWETKTVNGVLRTAAVLRGSEYSGATFEVLGAYPVPHLVRYFSGRSPAVLLQLRLLLRGDPRNASLNAEVFREAAGATGIWT